MGYESLYPSALHNRFVHSLGVFHLGKKAINYLRLNIGTNSDEYPVDKLQNYPNPVDKLQKDAYHIDMKSDEKNNWGEMTAGEEYK